MSQTHDLPILSVVSGLHAGSECVLPSQPFTIGVDPAADVILHDDGIAPIHLVLEAEGGDLRINIRADGVVVEGTALENGETVLAAFPVGITLAGVQLLCRGPASATPEIGVLDDVVIVRPASALLPRTTAGRAAAAGLIFVLIAVVSGRMLSGGSTAHAAVSSSRAIVEDGIGRYGPPPTAKDLRLKTMQKIRMLGIAGMGLDVDAGIVTMTGHLDVSDGPKLHALELWFDRRFGDNAVLLSQVVMGHNDPPPAIALESVWAGPNPNILVHGRRYTEGDSLPDGAVIEKITEQNVQLLQNGRQYVLSY